MGTDQFEQLSFEHMPIRLFACTPSRLAAFDCPRRYRFTYVDRPAPPRGQPWAHNVLGATVHVALHRWWTLPSAQRTPQAGGRLVVQYWQNLGFRDAAQSAQACADAAAWVRNYLVERVDPAVDPIGVERTVSACTERLALSGRVDRIDERDGELVIVDYKTGRAGLRPDDARDSAALALYVVGVRQTLRRSCHRVELHHLPTADVVAFEHTEDTLAEHVARAEDTAQRIVAAGAALAAGAAVDEAFPPVTGSACAWCDFRRHCPEGQRASPEREPWAGLAASTQA